MHLAKECRLHAGKARGLSVMPFLMVPLCGKNHVSPKQNCLSLLTSANSSLSVLPMLFIGCSPRGQQIRLNGLSGGIPFPAGLVWSWSDHQPSSRRLSESQFDTQ
jgi:hypothetical protein